MLDLFYDLIFEDKLVIEHGQTPHQMNPEDAPPAPFSTVAVSDDVKGALPQTNRSEVDDDPDSKRQYVRALSTLNFLFTSRYLS